MITLCILAAYFIGGFCSYGRIYAQLRANSIDYCVRNWPRLYGGNPLIRWEERDKSGVQAAALGLSTIWFPVAVYWFVIKPIQKSLEPKHPRVLSEWEKKNNTTLLEERIKELERELQVGGT